MENQNNPLAGLDTMDEKKLSLALTDARSHEFITNFDIKLALAEKLVNSNSKLVPFKNAGDVLIVLQAASDFKMPISFALGNIHPIGGKASAGVHLIAGLILKAKITFEIIEDLAPVWEYLSQGYDVTQDLIDKYPERYTFIKAGAKPEIIKAVADSGKIAVIRKAIIDYRTTIRMTRWVKLPNGEFEKMVIDGSFTRSEAKKAGLYEQNPHTWEKYEKDMIYARAFMRAAKRIGDDVLLGLSEVGEMAHVYNIPIQIDSEGNAVPVYEKGKITVHNNENVVDIEAEEITQTPIDNAKPVEQEYTEMDLNEDAVTDEINPDEEDTHY